MRYLTKSTKEIEGMGGMIDCLVNDNGDYVCHPEYDAAHAEILEEHEINPELRTPTSSVCTIGFSEKEQKWYGWSHRAFAGFAVGDATQEGDCCTESGWIEGSEEYEANKPMPVGFTAQNLDDAKRMAVAFAACVS